MTHSGWTAILVGGSLAGLIGLTLGATGMTMFRAMFVGVNVATMLAYGYDKYVSQARGRRLPEAALHIMAAAGGTPGAFLGQLVFRHKTRDRRFRLVFWTIAVLQLVFLALARMQTD